MDFAALREQMVSDQLEARGIRDERVLEAMRRIPRHEFVPRDLQHLAYRDGPLPIGNDQTISQPFIVALMTELLGLTGTETILEVGAGSGYQTAILSMLVEQVFSLERDRYLADQAATRLSKLGCENVEIYVGDGSQGLADMAPYDGILVSAAAPAIPGPLRSQLVEGGRLVLPVGNRHNQMLQRVTRTGDRYHTEQITPVMFVLLYGRYGFAAERWHGPDED